MNPRMKLRQRLCAEQAYRCCYCGIALAAAGAQHDAATLEHIVPACIGGPTSYANAVVACRYCNFGRGTMRADSYLQLVRRLGREQAYEKGRRWQRRHDDGLRAFALKQYTAAGLIAIPARYRRRLVCAMRSAWMAPV